MLQVTKEIQIESFDDLKEVCSASAKCVLGKIENNDRKEELMQHLEDVFACEEVILLTSINGYLCYNEDNIYGDLGIRTEEDILEDIEEIKNNILKIEEEKKCLADKYEECESDIEALEIELEKLREELEE